MKITVQWISPNLAVIGAKMWSNFGSITLHDYTKQKAMTTKQTMHKTYMRPDCRNAMEKKDKLN